MTTIIKWNEFVTVIFLVVFQCNEQESNLVFQRKKKLNDFFYFNYENTDEKLI